MDDADRAQEVLLLSLDVTVPVAAVRARLAAAGASACTDCGDPIDPARRAALPSATRCFGCQSDREGGAC
ncbi:TraR/DksA C4-type zinc finger protein [Azospirillum halopraeferens]|uniref:TraR/DksA C4-type zinc finger protein n=1 Tax=Azospirillum halopraeferens TaxID=34010 RepID=UPI0005583CB3|nr:TraR/DksA C4-type zinc finger protein [Azospirillum halopraeferens]